ncbi:MAG: chemotaxis protein MotB [Chlorobiaceae bacterium]|nr:chemotaxis protein MotB [Chlorobiaceae bacterium]MBA4309096.1 chemotaxis protein MotB [Chlorobiaceae bacterium]
MGLFIILYAVSKIDNTKYQEMISAMGNVFGSQNPIGQFESLEPNLNSFIETTEIINLKEQVSQLIEENDYTGFLSLEENERGITIRIMDKILFQSGSSVLGPSSFEILNKLAGILRTIPNDIRVEGHTDDIPINSPMFPSNWHLSVSRALNTAYYLIENEGLNPDKVSIVGYGEYQPIAPNADEGGRAINRRVDIVILNE